MEISKMILYNDIAILENDTHISKWVKEHNSLTHNKSLENELKYYVKKCDHVLEIGAFIGDNTSFLTKLAEKVYSYEPNPIAYECLEHNAKNWSNVVIHNKGFGKESGKMGIALSENVGASHLKDGNEIDIITIDSLGLEIYKDRLDFIVMDCEGMEVDILKGGEKTLSTFKPLMLIEVNRSALERYGYTPKDLLELLTSYGYKYKNIFNEPMNGEQYDILCF